MSKSAKVEFQYSPYLKVVLSVTYYGRHDFCAHVVDLNKMLVGDARRVFSAEKIRTGTTPELPIDVDEVKHIILSGLGDIHYDAAASGNPYWKQLQKDIDIGDILRECTALREEVKPLRTRNLGLQGEVEWFQATIEKIRTEQQDTSSPTAPTTTTYQRNSTHRRITHPTKTELNMPISTRPKQQTKLPDLLSAIRESSLSTGKSTQRSTRWKFESSSSLTVDISVRNFYKHEFHDHAVDVNKELTNAVHNVILAEMRCTPNNQCPVMEVDQVIHVIVNGVEDIYYKTAVNRDPQWKRLDKDLNIGDILRERTALRKEIKSLRAMNLRLQEEVEKLKTTIEKIRTGQYKPTPAASTKTNHQGNPIHRSIAQPTKTELNMPTSTRPKQQTKPPTSFSVVTENIPPKSKPTQPNSEKSDKSTVSNNPILKNLFDRAKKFSKRKKS